MSETVFRWPAAVVWQGVVITSQLPLPFSCPVAADNVPGARHLRPLIKLPARGLHRSSCAKARLHAVLPKMKDICYHFLMGCSFQPTPGAQALKCHLFQPRRPPGPAAVSRKASFRELLPLNDKGTRPGLESACSCNWGLHSDDFLRKLEQSSRRHRHSVRTSSCTANMTYSTVIHFCRHRRPLTFKVQK